MMELGATVCTPRAPRCGSCPVARWCRAHTLGIAEALPSAAARNRKPVRLTLSAAVLLDARGRTLLLRQKSDHSTLFSSLWQFPAIQRVEAETRRKLARYLQSAFGICGSTCKPCRQRATRSPFAKFCWRHFWCAFASCRPPAVDGGRRAHARLDRHRPPAHLQRHTEDRRRGPRRWLSHKHSALLS